MLSGMFKKASLGAVGGSGGSRSRGADLRDLVPNFVQGSDQSFRKLRANIEKEDDVFYAEQLTRVAKLGEGGFGVVYKCKLEAKGRVLEDYVVASGNMVAVKQLKSRAQILQEHLSQGLPPSDAPSLHERVAAQHTDAMHEFAHEVLMLKKLKHPNVIGYIGCAVFTVGGSEELALVLEFSEHGSLKEMITAPSKMARAFTVSEGLRWACDIASGMAFLHRCIPPIIHRDLKPANIMLCGPSRIAKVADFGLASLEISKLKDEARSLSIKAARSASSTNLEAMAGGGGGGSGGAKGVPPTGGVGSLRYMAPENFRGEAYTHTVDQYSFAVIMYELLMRERAYEGMFLSAESIAEGAASARALRPPVPAAWPEEVTRLLAACWHADPGRRPPFKEVATAIGAMLDGSDEAARQKLLKKLAAGSKRGILEKMGITKSV
ncbi:hypothetical protein KFE25_012074 [Diacronema lutheri]|uniref:Protein kinase domain-containing protein n=1 Tax=Diacronema lutheri TaxID=2081491 RepID=A0A8J5XD74_DIALT|nr:hypothetical protein KFE25_012074 [Diacronema lutheri]